MKAILHNGHWSTCGGGESLSGRLAVALRHMGLEVTVTGPPGVDLADVGERLDFDSSQLPYVGVRNPSELSEVAQGSTLFFNCSFGSTQKPVAPLSVYYCHFPQFRRLPRARALLQHGLQRSLNGSVVHISTATREWSSQGRLSSLSGTGTASLEVLACVDPTVLRIRNDSRECDLEVVHAEERFLLAPGTSIDVPTHLGAVAALRSRGQGPLSPRWTVSVDGATSRMIPASGILRGLESPAVSIGRRYSQIWSNSRYTAEWIRRRWKSPSVVMYPPVKPLPIPEVRNELNIAVVGRFFPPGDGNSKGQLELIRAFRLLVEREPRRGWHMVLMGAVADRHQDFLRQVQQQAQGLPIRVSANCRRDVLEQELRQSGLLWVGTGLRENLRKHPDRAEHFGIAVVEAMSAGVIPLVPPIGGPAEVVRDPLLIARSLDEYAVKSSKLADRADLRTRLRSEAMVYDLPHFEARVRQHVDTLLLRLESLTGR